MTVRDVTTSFARTLVDEWARAGVTDVSIAPGSRSAPLALAFADHRRIRTHVFLDERSAAFFALGVGKASGRPGVVLCTSGTAAANLHPAVLEAHHARVPLLVCTADRPPELRDSGAGQTIDQVGLYGNATRWFHEPGAPEDRPGAPDHWRSTAARAVAAAQGPPAGPVHLNFAFREPLVPTGAPLVDSPGRSGGRPWTTSSRGARTADGAALDRLADLVRNHPRGMVVAGWGSDARAATVERFATAAGWPVLADPISGVRAGRHAVSTYEALIRVPGFTVSHRPDLVVRLGAPPTSKVLTAWLDSQVPQILVDPDGDWLDPAHAVSDRLVVDAEPLLTALHGVLGDRESGDSAWLDGWLAAEVSARTALDAVLDGWADPFEGRVARDVVDAVPDGGALVVASSMPVRDVEGFARRRDDVRYFANRGVNGIDGFVSTALGIAATHDGPTTALLGDLCFLHDANGLLGAVARGLDVTFVVLDNDGAGIFSFLPQADLPEHFETLFGTPHALDLAEIARAHGVPVEKVEKAGDVGVAVSASARGGGVRVLVIPTDRADNVARHRQVWAAVATAIGG